MPYTAPIPEVLSRVAADRSRKSPCGPRSPSCLSQAAFLASVEPERERVNDAWSLVLLAGDVDDFILDEIRRVEPRSNLRVQPQLHRAPEPLTMLVEERHQRAGMKGHAAQSGPLPGTWRCQRPQAVLSEGTCSAGGTAGTLSWGLHPRLYDVARLYGLWERPAASLSSCPR